VRRVCIKEFFVASLDIKAELRHVRIHDFRHTWVTRRLSLGHNTVEVSREAGHSSFKITVDTYYHWVPNDTGDDMDQLDQMHPNAPPGAPRHPAGKASTEIFPIKKPPYGGFMSLWCRRPDSNRHGSPHHPLKMACLPDSTTSA